MSPRKICTQISTLIAGTALTAFAAAAADMPVKAKAPVSAPVGLTAVDWSGFYLGGHVGWGQALSRGTYDDGDDNLPIDFKANGVLGGVQAGYNWQVGRLVYGIEGDGSWANLNKSRSDSDDSDQKMKTNFLGSLRLRSGAAIDNVWLYGTIGLGYAHSKFTVTGDVPNPASRNLNGWGLVSGFGAEYAFAPNWSLRGEYLYYAINKRADIRSLTDDSDDHDFIKLDGVHVVRLAANYRFNGSQARAPAPAMNWSGYYVGAHAGWGASRIVGVYDEAGDSGSFNIDPRGVLGGLQLGYNWQNGAWVYGLEADASWAGMKKGRTDTEGDHETLKTNMLASVRGRVGIAADNRLYYLTAGWGFVRSKLNVVEDGSPAKANLNAHAFVVGSGMDWALNPNWSVRLEGLTYLANKRRDISNLVPSDSDSQDFIRQDLVAVVRAGLNYRFGGP